jgi:hypothetical protein
MRGAAIMLLSLSAFSQFGQSPLLGHGNQVDYSNNHPKTCEKIL